MIRDNSDQLKEITRSMTYKYPQLGDNVLKFAKLVMVCKNKGCYKPVTVTDVTAKQVIYSCPEHGRRKYDQFDWLDITGSTMLEFRKVGL